MKLGQFESGTTSEPWAGVVRDERVVHLRDAANDIRISLPRDVLGIVNEWEWREKVDLAVAHALESETNLYDRADLTQREPVTNPQK